MKQSLVQLQGQELQAGKLQSRETFVEMANRVFVYGTLMFPSVAIRVAEIDEWGEPVVLDRFERLTVEHPRRERAWFPAIQAADAQVSGLLYRDVSDEQLRFLDAFENVTAGDYTRDEVVVQTSTGTCQASAYVCGPGLQPYLGKVWDAWDFSSRQLDWYLRHVVDPFVAKGRQW